MIHNAELTCKTFEKLKIEFPQYFVGKKLTSKLNNFLKYIYSKKRLSFSDNLVKKVLTTEKYIITLKIDRQSIRKDPYIHIIRKLCTGNTFILYECIIIINFHIIRNHSFISYDIIHIIHSFIS